MSNSMPAQTAPSTEDAARTGSTEATSQSRPKKQSLPSAPTPRPKKGSVVSKKTHSAEGRVFENDVTRLDPTEQELVKKMLVDGSTFEDAVETINARDGKSITLIAVQNFFQGNLELQKARVQHMVKSADALLATIDKNPESAEAQLARATFMTGMMRLHRDDSSITPLDAERSRMQRTNLNLKYKLLNMQKLKVLQELRYSRARTSLILVMQEKIRQEILDLQNETSAHRAGEPMGPEVLQRIQQLYGLACQPLLYGETTDVTAKA